MKLITRRICLAASLFLFASTSAAQPLTPELYVDIEIQIRQLTNDGMQQRLFLLKVQNEDSIEDQGDLDGETVEMINQIFSSNGITASEHAAYGTQNTEAIGLFLNQHVSRQQRLAEISVEFQSLSSQITAELSNQ